MKRYYASHKHSFLRITSCILIFGSAYYSYKFQSPAAANNAALPVKTARFKSYIPVQPAVPLRNPFLSSRTIDNVAPENKAASVTTPPILRGIIAHENKTIGIFEYNEQSSYHTAGDKIGLYTIKNLTSTTATILTDSQQQIILKLED